MHYVLSGSTWRRRRRGKKRRGSILRAMLLTASRTHCCTNADTSHGARVDDVIRRWTYQTKGLWIKDQIGHEINIGRNSAAVTIHPAIFKYITIDRD